MGPTTTPMPKMAMAMPRSWGGKVSRRMAWDMGCSPPPPTPWMIRKNTSWARLVAEPQRMELTVNRMREASR